MSRPTTEMNNGSPLRQVMALISARRLDDAQRVLEPLLAANPEDAEILYHAGVITLCRGDAARAEKIFRRTLDLRSDFARGHNGLGRALSRLGRVDEAIACQRRAIELRPRLVPALADLADLLIKFNRYEEALDLYDRVLALDPKQFDACNNRGLALQRLGRLEEAARDIRRAHEIRPDIAIFAINLGRILRVLGQIDDAEAVFRHVLQREPENAEAIFEIGIIREEKSDVEGAIALYRQSLTVNPAASAVRTRLKLALKICPDLASDIAACRKRLAESPDNDERITLAGLLWQHGETDEAEALLGEVAASDEANPAAHYHMGLLSRSGGDPGRARACFERARALAPDDVLTQAALSSLDAAETGTRMSGSKRIALHVYLPYHYHILRPIFDALKEEHACLLTPHVKEIRDFEPEMVVLADSHTPLMRSLLPDAVFVFVRHGLISKHMAGYAARIADFACITSESSRDWYIENHSRPRRDFWITGYPQMDPLFGPEPLALDFHPPSDGMMVLYAPTWTPGISSADMLDDRLGQLICADRDDITLVIKPHPITAMTKPEWLETWRRIAGNDDRVYLCDDPATNVMPLLKNADVLVTDASSVMFQYLAVDRPIVLITNPGRFQNAHFDPGGIEWRWRDVGEEVHDVARLAEAVNRALESPSLGAEARARYRAELFGSYTDGHAGERIAKNITELEL